MHGARTPTSGLVILSVLACCAIAEEEVFVDKITNVAECTPKAAVAMGDFVGIEHTGFDEDGNKVDGNINGEPLMVHVGAGQILAGMEQALVGMCRGEQVSATIPPHLAYDDPSKQFQRKPVPDGTTVRYEIKVVSIAAGGPLPKTSRAAPSTARGTPAAPDQGLVEMLAENWMLVAFLAVGVVVAVGVAAQGSGKPKRTIKKPKKR
jgi:hypothetical protein